MVLVDIFVPSLGNTYDFQVNEEIVISSVIEEVTELISQKEHTKLVGPISGLSLCQPDKDKILSPQNTLKEYNISNGASLILL